MKIRALCLALLTTSFAAAQKVGAEAPDLTWTAALEFGDVASGKLSDLRGSVVLLEFISTRQASSRQEVAELNTLYAEKKELGLVVIAVTSEEPAAAAAWVKKNDVKHPVGVGFNSDYDFTGVPHAYLVDKDGKILWRGHPHAVDKEILEKALVSAKPAVVVAGLEDVQALRRTKDHGAAYRKCKQLLDGGGLSERAVTQAKDWMQASETFVQTSVAKADQAEAQKDVYEMWVALEPVAALYQGVPGADAAKTRFDALVADPKNKRELEGGRKLAEAKTKEAAMDFDGAYAAHKDVEKLFGGTRAAKAAAAAWRAIEKDGKLGFDPKCGFCTAGGKACPQHAKGKKKK